MRKYKVLKKFYAIKEDETYNKDDVIEFSNERAEEIEKKFSKLSDKYIAEIKEEPEEEPKKENKKDSKDKK